MVSNIWQDYDRWNEAIYRRCLGPQSAHTPVYLDLDDGMLAEIGETAGWPPGPQNVEFLLALRRTFLMDGDFLMPHVRRAVAWQGGSENKPPPFIALLGFFSYVAYQMQNDGKLNAGNYHSRLALAVYDGPSDKSQRDRLGRSFRKWVVPFWDLFAEWLEQYNQGSLGLPTADPGPYEGRKFIGYPISQAIITRRDRPKLVECFRFGRLRPGDDISLEEMRSLLRQWIPTSSLSQVVKTTFDKGPDDQVAVAQIALAELKTWGLGSVTGGGKADGRVQSHRLMLFMDKELEPRPQAWFSVGFRAPDGPREVEYKVLRSSQPLFDESSGARLDGLTFEVADAGVWQSRDDISISDLLVTQAQLESDDASKQLDWCPSKVVVLEFDDDTRRFVSAAKTSVGKRLSILTHEQAEEKVRSLIDPALVEGTSYQSWGHEEMRGIPKGWVLLGDVRLGSSIVGETEGYDALRTADPDTRINLEGGVKIPGERAWLASRLPTVNFVSEAALEVTQLELVKNRFFEATPVTRLPVSAGDGPAKSADLSKETITVGSYKLTLAIVRGNRTETRSMTFGVCSADFPRLDKRGALADQALTEDPLYLRWADAPYLGGELEQVPTPREEDLPPKELGVGASAEAEERTEPNEPRIWGEPDPSWEEPAPPDDGTDSADYGRTEEVGVSRPEQKRPRKPGPIDLKDVLVWWASSPYPSLERADHIIFR